MTITLKNSGWFILIGILLAVGVYGVTTITDTGVTTQEIDNSNGLNITGFRNIQFYGEDDTTANTSTDLRIIGISQADDGTGASNRAKLSLWTGQNISDPSNRGISIETHRNGTSQDREVSFYSYLKNLSGFSSSGKVFQWKWGENTDGIFQFVHLNRIEFPESYTGFYQNQSTTNAGIESLDEDFILEIDSDNDQSGESFRIYRNGNTSDILFKTDFGDSRNYLSQKRTYLHSLPSADDTWLYFWNNAKSDYDYIQLDKSGFAGVGNTGFYFNNAIYTEGNLSSKGLEGAGNGFACIDSSGNIYRSASACA